MSGYYRHTYQPGETGMCEWEWWSSDGELRLCRSTQRSSVMHDDPESDFREMHDHGGGDCMCFESEWGPSYREALARYVSGR